jgi:hypothetical protein
MARDTGEAQYRTPRTRKMQGERDLVIIHILVKWSGGGDAFGGTWKAAGQDARQGLPTLPNGTAKQVRVSPRRNGVRALAGTLESCPFFAVACRVEIT